MAYLEKKMTNEAAAAFREALSIADEYAPAHRSLGEVLLDQGQIDGAIA